MALPNFLRRDFLRLLFTGAAPMVFLNKLSASDKEGSSNKDIEEVLPAEEMRPGQIQAAIKKGPFAFIPISPAFEWHSFHLPMGTDALISESICKEMAALMGGIWFRPLSLGLDVWRNEEQKKAWGFKPDEQVYGMNFPDLPFTSEYCLPEEMKAVIQNRVNVLKDIGIEKVYLVNHHGGVGQNDLIEEVAEEFNGDNMKVKSVQTTHIMTLVEEDGYYGVGGHAGYSETTWLMAFRPELIDLSQLEEGELSVRKMGILHTQPIIEEKWNPHNVSEEVAKKLKSNLMSNFIAEVRKG